LVGEPRAEFPAARAQQRRRARLWRAARSASGPDQFQLAAKAAVNFPALGKGHLDENYSRIVSEV